MDVKSVFVTGAFDQITSTDVRFFDAASKSGLLNIMLWSDELVRQQCGSYPKFPQEERSYFINSMRCVKHVTLASKIDQTAQIPELEGIYPRILAVTAKDHTPQKRQYCKNRGIEYRIIDQKQMSGFPPLPPVGGRSSSRKKVVVTGSFDWLHSGHVRFFEETCALGDLYVVVGHDANIRLLKGEGHPLFSQEERSYMVQSIRFVKCTLISSGHGWMDGEPEIEAIKPHIYAVNQDGDKPEKRKFCEDHGIEYLVLERKPKEGLPRRESTMLRGF